MIDFFTYFIYVPILFSSFFLVIVKNTAYLGNAIDLFILPNKLRVRHFIALLLISFIVGFRYQVGTDWEAYKDTFEFIRLNNSISNTAERIEWGYLIINEIIAYLGGTYTLLFFVLAFISWCFIFKSVPAVLLPLTIYFLITDEAFFLSMNLVRQFVSMSIFLYALKFIITRNYIVYIVLIALASLFHSSAILLFPLCFIPYPKLYNQKFWIMAFIVSLLFSNTPAITDILINSFTKLFELIPLMSKYTEYFSIDEKFGAQDRQNSGLGLYFKHLVTLLVLIFSKSIINKYPQTKVYFIIYFVGVIIYNLFSTSEMIGRVNAYLLSLRPIILALIVIYLWRKNKYRIVSIGLVVLYFFLYLSTIYTSSNMCSPYRFDFMRF